MSKFANGDVSASWTGLLAHLGEMPRMTIVEQRADYVHVTATSAVLHFVDDLEFSLRVERGEIAVRSASRVGYYDFGVNRARVESVRAALRKKGLVK